MLVIVRPPHSQDRVIRLNFLICWVRFRWRISLINDLRVIMDRRMCFTEHIDVIKALAMLGFIRRVSEEFRDPYTLKDHRSLVRKKLLYASCVWAAFYDVHVNRVERVQRQFISVNSAADKSVIRAQLFYTVTLILDGSGLVIRMTFRRL
jgi:hypothetical protein